MQSCCLQVQYSAAIVIRKPAFQQLWGDLLVSFRFTHAYAWITCSDACIFSCMLFPPGGMSFLAKVIILSKKVFFCLNYVDFCKYYTLFNFLAMMRQCSFFFMDRCRKIWKNILMISWRNLAQGIQERPGLLLMEIGNSVYFFLMLHLEIILANDSPLKIKSNNRRHIYLYPLLSERLFIRWIEHWWNRQSEAFIKRIFAVILSVLLLISSENRTQRKLTVYWVIVQGSKLQLYIVFCCKMFLHCNESSISSWYIHSLDSKDLQCVFHAMPRNENLGCFWLVVVSLRKNCFFV